MKLLHTGDWHVGKALRNRSRADEHRASLAEIAQIARDRRVDVVLVAGDLFDSAAPTPEAEDIVYSALLDFTKSGAEVVVIAGNHDNPRRLEALSPLLKHVRIHTGCSICRPEDGGVVSIQSKAGETARIALVPFISQRQAIHADELMDQGGSENRQTYDLRCQSVIAALCATFSPDTINVVVAHLAVLGGIVSGDERQAHTVFDYYISAEAFPASAHYVALGHLHKAQSIPARCPIRYCGPPFQLDFGDTTLENSVFLVEAHPGLPAQIETIPLSPQRRLITLSGSLEQIGTQSDKVGDAFVRLILHEPTRSGLAEDARSVFPNAVDIRVWSPDKETAKKNEMGENLSPPALFEAYLKDRGIEDPPLVKLFHDLWQEEETLAPDPA